MPLSEHEQRLLEQMEQQLLSDDPRFASTMRGPRRTGGGGRRTLAIGVAVAGAGLALLVVTLIFLPNDLRIWLGGLALLLMFGGILYAVSGAGGGSHGEGAAEARGGPTGVVGPGGRTQPRPGGAQRRRTSGTFMQRLEQRWDRRRDDRWS